MFRGTFADLVDCGVQIVVVGSLAVLGETFVEFAAANHLDLETLVRLPNNIWTPSNCPLCASQVPLAQ